MAKNCTPVFRMSIGRMWVETKEAFEARHSTRRTLHLS
jgi:hypothetical protein